MNRAIVTVFSAIFVLTILIMGIQLAKTTAEFKKFVENASALAVERKSEINSLKDELLNREQTIKLLKSKISAQADPSNDRLEMDIYNYIDSGFYAVPDVVSKEIAKQVIRVSMEESIAPELIMGIIQVESSFNPSAISNKNARGLMQVMPEWVPKFGLKRVDQLHNISTNIECGVKVLKIHIGEANGDVTGGLYRYVGKSDEYSGKVYEAIGKFVSYRAVK